MEQTKDLTVEPFKARKHDFRSDKGQHHRYPKTRKRWNPRICLRHSKTNLNLTDSNAQDAIMEPKHKFKGAPSMREYWRKKKAEERAKKEK